MNDDAQFEDRLRRQALKPIPSEWRGDILWEASRAVEGRNHAAVSSVSWYEMLKSQLAGLLGSSPRAWAALATVWVIIFVMNLSGRHESVTAATLPVAQARMALKQKQLLLAELAGRTETREAVQPRAVSPGPRSQRREETSVG